jgi:hypothetical protein
MSLAKCVVKLVDAHGTKHEATVHAKTLYEAVVRGLNQLSEEDVIPSCQFSWRLHVLHPVPDRATKRFQVLPDVWARI